MPLPWLPQTSSLPPWVTGPLMPQQQRQNPVIRPTQSFDVRGRGTGGGMGMGSFLPPPRNPSQPRYPGPNVSSSSSNMGFNTSIPDQTGDYRNIMSRYEQLLNSQPTSYTDYNPEMLNYQESPEAAASLAQLSELARTGGLSEQDQASLRARGISPIRAVYANALRNLNRRQNIAGGYAPGLGASTARMAREQSEQAAQASTNVNANIAERIQQGRLSAAPQYEAATAARTSGMNRIAELNAARRAEADQFNRQMRLRAEESDRNRRLEGLRGMTSLYGTNPALTESFSRQALQRRGQDDDMSRYLIDAYLRGTRG